MPSKRTNDSVERILQELNREQEAKGIRDGITDSNVDDILRTIPRSTAPEDTFTATLGPISDADMPAVEVSGDLKDPESRFSTQAINDLLADLPIFQNQAAADAAHIPASGRTAASAPARQASSARPAQTPAQAPTRAAAQTPAQTRRTAPQPQSSQSRPQPQPEPRPQPAAQPEQQPAAEAQKPGRTGTVDTTRTGIIKNFLRQMGTDDGVDNTQLSQRKNQFQRFFEESIAVVPGKDGKLPADKKKSRKRGLFGRGGDAGEVTDEFVPINVSLLGRRDDTAPQPAREEPQEEPEQAPEEEAAPAPRPRRKGFLGLFGRRAQEQTYSDTYAGDTYAGTESDTGSYPVDDLTPEQPDAEPAPARQAPRTEAPQPAAPEPEKFVYRSKYAGVHRVHGSLTDTLSSLGLTHTSARDLRQAAEPRQADAQTPAPRTAAPQPRAEQPEAAPETQPPRKKRDTVEFTPRRKPHEMPEQPEQDTFPTSEPVGEPVMTKSDTLTTGFTVTMDRDAEQEDTHDFVASMPPQKPAAPAGDTTGTITGQVRLDAGADQEVHTGQVQLGQQPQPAESTSDFALDFLDNQVEQRPDTEQFVRGIAQTLNTIPDTEDSQTGRYAEAAQRLTHAEPEDGEEPERPHRRKKHGTRLAGTPLDEREPEPEGPFAQQQGHHKPDYETTDDAPRVRQELDKQVLYRTVAVIVSAAAALVLLYLGIAAVSSGLPMPGMLAPGVATGESAAALAAAGASAAPMLTVMLILLLVVLGVNWQTMAFGLLGLARAPTADSMSALAGVGALVQLLVFLAQPGWYRPSDLCLLAGPAALVLCGNALGKQLDATTTRANFDLVSAGVDHAVAYRLRDAGVVRTVTRGLGEPKPSLLVSRPTVLLKNFLAGSAAHRTSDKNQQQFSWILGVCGLLSFLFTLAYRQDAGMAFTALAAVWCLGAPLAGTLISALPAQKMQRSAARVGAVIPGWKDIRQLGRINVIQITARDLFPTGCVALAGIRPVGKERIDQAITYAASILAEGSPTLRDVFLGMIGDNRKLLSKVDELKTFYRKGYVGWIGGTRVLVGNRALMQDYDIKIPSLEFEQRHSVNQRRVIYLAASGNLMAMFLVSYQRDPDTAAVLEGLRQAGMSMIVDCDDFNCDVHLIEAVYGLPSGSVKVLSDEERQALAPATAWLPESEGNMLHLGGFASFVGGREAAAGAAEGEYRAGVVLTASVLISCVMAVIMSLAGGIASLPTVAVVLYQLAWAVLALIFPMTRRY